MTMYLMGENASAFLIPTNDFLGDHSKTTGSENSGHKDILEYMGYQT